MVDRLRFTQSLIQHRSLFSKAHCPAWLDDFYLILSLKGEP
jgi:hypothetical protein